MPWFSEIEAESRLITRKRQVGRQAAQIEPEASNDNKIRVAIPAGIRQPLGRFSVYLASRKGTKGFSAVHKLFGFFPITTRFFPVLFAS